MALYIQLDSYKIAEGLEAIGWGGAGGSASLTYSATAPESPINGVLWYDTVSSQLKMWNGGIWSVVSVSQETIISIQGYANTATTKASEASASAESALASKNAITGLSVVVNSLPTGSTATASYSNGVITLGVPTGATGLKGDAGEVSTAQLTTALATKADTSHTHTKTDVGLSNVDNTSDANKPVSTAQATAIGLKADSTHSHTAFTGLTVTALKETAVAMVANDIDLSLGNYFTKTISTATTLTVSNVPTSGTVGYFILELTNGGAGAVTYPTGTKWAKGTAPTLTASGVDLLRFVTRDAGTTWRGSRIDEDSK